MGFVIPLVIVIASFILTKSNWIKEKQCIDPNIEFLWIKYNNYSKRNGYNLPNENLPCLIAGSYIGKVKISITKPAWPSTILDLTGKVENSDGINVKCQTLKCSTCMDKKQFCDLIEWFVTQVECE